MLRLPIGYDDFGAIIEKKLDFVDKSLFIKDILDDEGIQVLLLVRPRRFGKTLNLSMLRYFLAEEVEGRKTAELFSGLKISQAGEAYRQQQGQYPVVFITFKGIKENSYRLAYENIAKLLSDLYGEHRYLLFSHNLSDQQKKTFAAIINKQASEPEIKNALKDLTHYLYLHHNIAPWLLIDEYDTPLQASHGNGYYAEMIGLMRGMLGEALKGNLYLHRAVVTGVLRIAKESLFSGLNNLKVYSLLHRRYGEHFGFTEAEVAGLLGRSGLGGKAAEIKAWYNGYRFGGGLVYNPWSIVNCVQEGGAVGPYWVNTSDNELLRELLSRSGEGFKGALEGLLRGEPQCRVVDEHVSFGDLAKGGDAAAWGALLLAGYLSAGRVEEVAQGKLCELEVPNEEVRRLYQQLIEQWLSGGRGAEWYNEFLGGLLQGEMEKFEAGLRRVLLETASAHDLGKEPEAFYHGLMLGLTSSLRESYDTKSNKESGHGRYDFAILPKGQAQLGIIMEFKKLPGAARPAGRVLQGRLAKLAQAALAQIGQQGYLAEFRQRGVQSVLQVGIAYSGKRFALAWEKTVI